MIIEYLIIIHFISDFWFQTENQALTKSKDFNALTSHVLTYSGLITFFVYMYSFNFIFSLLFGMITFTFHWVIDFYTSQKTNYYYENKQMYGIPGFWFIISIDQALHLIQLNLTENFIKWILN